jgi:hypothetical protein
MDEKEKNLLIEIHVTADDGREKNFTGYPVAPGRILTARHGLLPDVISEAKIIKVRWHELEVRDPRRDWRPAKVIWEDGPLDVALLACNFPDGLTGYGWLSDQPPRETNPPMRWASAGIAKAGDKSKTASGSFDFHGNVYSAAGNKLRFDIGVEDEALARAYWEGASGMPIFVDRRIIGVAMSCDEATEARRFKASPVRKMLRDPKFRDAIGYDAREKRRDEARGRAAGATRRHRDRRRGHHGRRARASRTVQAAAGSQPVSRRRGLPLRTARIRVRLRWLRL